MGKWIETTSEQHPYICFVIGFSSLIVALCLINC